MGAGTGLLGLKLREKGMSLQYTGLDASSVFAERLNNNNPNYAEGRQLMLGRGVDQFPDEFKGAFDLCTASGVFLKGHMPATAMDDCHSALKVGGYFVTAMRSMYYEYGTAEGYREKLDELINAGKFQLVNTFTFMRGIEGEVGLFAPLESRLLCFVKSA